MKYPRGKKYDDDEGEFEIRVAADPEAQVVRIDFGKPVRWIAFESDRANEFADLIKRKAKEV